MHPTAGFGIRGLRRNLRMTAARYRLDLLETILVFTGFDRTPRTLKQHCMPGTVHRFNMLDTPSEKEKQWSPILFTSHNVMFLKLVLSWLCYAMVVRTSIRILLAYMGVY